MMARLRAVRVSTVVAVCALVALNAAPWLVGRYVVVEPLFAWRKGPLSFEKPGYPPPGTEVFALWLLVLIVDGLVSVGYLGGGLWRRVSARIAPALRPLLAAGGAVVALVLLEVGVRAYVGDHLLTPFRPSADTFWQIQPHLRGFFNRTGAYTIDSDANGFRGGRENQPQADAGTYRIMTIGDSGPFGHGVEEPQTWQALLEKHLRGRYPTRAVEVINACCPGWTTWECIRFLRARGLAFHPSLLIIGFNNDSGFDYMEEKERQAAAPSALQRLLYRSELYLLLRKVVFDSHLRISASSTPEPPSPDRDRPLVRRVSREDFEANIREIIALARENGCALVLVNNPVNKPVYEAYRVGATRSNDRQDELHRKAIDFTYRDSLKRIAAESGVPVMNANDLWNERRDVVDLFLPNDDLHPNVAGHALLGQQMADLIERAGVLGPVAGSVP